MTDQTLRRVDDLLSELVDMVETARTVPMSSSCVVPRERVLDLLDELREVMPPEMDEARRLLATRESVLSDAQAEAQRVRERVVTDADTILADAAHRAERLRGEAQADATGIIRAAEIEQARLVSATSVQKVAAEAAAAVRAEAKAFDEHTRAATARFDAETRAEAQRWADATRHAAEEYAAHLGGDVDSYADRTLGELVATLNRAAMTAEQGRNTLGQRRASGARYVTEHGEQHPSNGAISA
jgi:cell division septum initiation protein DivIVA